MALAGAMGGWIDLRGQPSGCDRRGAGRVRSCSEGGICRRLRDMPDDHTLNLRQRRDAGGFAPATGSATPGWLPTHTWTSLWTFSSRKLKSLKVGARRIDRIVRSREARRAGRGLDGVRGGSSSVRVPGSRSLTSSSSAGMVTSGMWPSPTSGQQRTVTARPSGQAVQRWRKVIRPMHWRFRSRTGREPRPGPRQR
jgi:hypothetical protein